VISGLNTKHLEAMELAREEILSCREFKDIKSAQPLAIGSGGTRTPFSLYDFKCAMRDEGSYECGGNFFWVKHHYTPVRNVTTNEASIEDDMKEKYAKPVAHVDHEFLVGVSRDTSNFDVQFDTLERLSPSEFDDSLLLAVRESVRNDDKEALKIWLQAFLTVKFKFVAIDNEDEKIYISIKARSRLVPNANVGGRTMLQRLLEFIFVLQRHVASHGPQDAEAMATLWQQKIGGNIGPSGESITESYVSVAVQVYNGMIAVEPIMNALLLAERLFNKKSPFDSVYKLQAIMQKCKGNHSLMAFVVTHVIDTIRNGLSTAGEYVHRTMVGKGQNNKGTIDLSIIKSNILTHLTVTYPAENNITDPFALDILKKASAHATYRELSGYASSRKELSWWAKLPQSCRTLYEVTEDLVYNSTFDHIIRQAMRNNAAAIGSGMVLEILNTMPINDSMSDIQAALANERPSVPVPVGCPSGAAVIATTSHDEITGEVSIAQVAGKEVEADVEEKLQPWLEYADKIVSRWTTLFVEPESAAQVCDNLKSIQLVNMFGKDLVDCVCMYYDVKQAGVSNVSPHIRHPSFRADNLRKHFVGVQSARESPDAMLEGDMCMILDAHAHGNHAQMGTALNKLNEPKPMQKSKETYLCLDAKTIEARKATNRAVKLDQVEQSLVFSGTPLQLEPKDRKNYNNTNLGNAIFPIGMPLYTSTWRLPPSLRKKLFGKRGVVLAGGATEGSYDAPTLDDGMEPVNWFEMAMEWYEEVLHSWCVKYVIHCTALDTVFALCCIRAKKGYVGFVCSDEHKMLFRARLVKLVFDDICQEGNPHYQAACASLMKEVNPEILAAATKIKRNAANAPTKKQTQPSTTASEQPTPPSTSTAKSPNPLSIKRLGILNQLKAMQGAASAPTGSGTEADLEQDSQMPGKMATVP